MHHKLYVDIDFKIKNKFSIKIYRVIYLTHIFYATLLEQGFSTMKTNENNFFIILYFILYYIYILNN